MDCCVCLNNRQHFLVQSQWYTRRFQKLYVCFFFSKSCSSKVNGNADYVLYKKDMDNLLNETFDKPCVLLFKFGWSQYFNDPQKYFGFDGTKAKFPGKFYFYL